MGWGDIFTILNKFVPKRAEKMRNKIEHIKRRQKELLEKKLPMTIREHDEYDKLCEQRKEYEQKLQNMG